jgi:Spy/CpxP family protein refolding chaperone
MQLSGERKEMKKQMGEVLTPEQLEMFNTFMEEIRPKRHPQKS